MDDKCTVGTVFAVALFATLLPGPGGAADLYITDTKLVTVESVPSSGWAARMLRITLSSVSDLRRISREEKYSIEVRISLCSEAGGMTSYSWNSSIYDAYGPIDVRSANHQDSNGKLGNRISYYFHVEPHFRMIDRDVDLIKQPADICARISGLRGVDREDGPDRIFGNEITIPKDSISRALD